MASDTNKYAATTFPLIGAMVLASIGALYFDGAWKIIPVVILLVLVATVSGTLSAQVKKMRSAPN